MGWREINWAYHSKCQDTLIDMVSRQYRGKVSWEKAQESGICMWIKDRTKLVRIYIIKTITYLTINSYPFSKTLREMNTIRQI